MRRKISVQNASGRFVMIVIVGNRPRQGSICSTSGRISRYLEPISYVIGRCVAVFARLHLPRLMTLILVRQKGL
jgi:hypothetical protein